MHIIYIRILEDRFLMMDPNDLVVL